MTTNSPLPKQREQNITQKPISTRRKILLALGTLTGAGGLIEIIRRGQKIDSENFEVERKRKDKTMQDSYTYAQKEKKDGSDREISELLTKKFNDLFTLKNIQNPNFRWRKIDNYILYLPSNQFDAMNPTVIGGYEILENGNLRRIEYNDADPLRQKFNIQYGEK